MYGINGHILCLRVNGDSYAVMLYDSIVKKMALEQSCEDTGLVMIPYAYTI